MRAALPASYSLVDGANHVLVQNRYLLSIRDLNLTEHLGELVEAGVTSFKIEGRLKDKNYVKNVVSSLPPGAGWAGGAEKFVQLFRAGYAGFEPDLEKTFNRGYSDYFIRWQRAKIGTPDTPKMVGEPIGTGAGGDADSLPARRATDLHNGDGLSFFHPKKS